MPHYKTLVMNRGLLVQPGKHTVNRDGISRAQAAQKGPNLACHGENAAPAFIHSPVPGGSLPSIGQALAIYDGKFARRANFAPSL
jgi:hypothetical protein